MPAAAEGTADIEALRLADMERGRGGIGYFEPGVVVFVVVDVFAGEIGDSDVDSELSAPCLLLICTSQRPTLGER